MPIRPFLSGQAFEPEAIRIMSLALEDVCDALGLRMTDDPATRLVAEKIIELAQRGVREIGIAQKGLVERDQLCTSAAQTTILFGISASGRA